MSRSRSAKHSSARREKRSLGTRVRYPLTRSRAMRQHQHQYMYALPPMSTSSTVQWRCAPSLLHSTSRFFRSGWSKVERVRTELLSLHKRYGEVPRQSRVEDGAGCAMIQGTTDVVPVSSSNSIDMQTKMPTAVLPALLTGKRGCELVCPLQY